MKTVSALLLVLLLATSVGAEPVPVDGDLRFPQAAEVTADLRLDATSALYWLAPAADPTPVFERFGLSAPSLEVTYVEEWRCVSDCATIFHPDLDEATRVYQEAVVTIVDAHGDRRAVVHDTLGPGGTLAVEDWSLSTVPREEALVGPGPSGSHGSGRTFAAVRSVLLAGDAVQLVDIDPGRVDLYGFTVDITYTAEDGTRQTERVETGERSASAASGMGNGPTDDALVRDVWLILKTTQGDLDLTGGGAQARIMSPWLVLSGDVTFPAVRGQLATPEAALEFTGPPATLSGSFLVRALDGPHDADPDWPTDPHRVRVLGDAEARTAGAAVTGAAGADASGALVALVSVLALAGAAAAWASGAGATPLAALYARLGKADIDRSAGRRRLLAVVRDQPGLSMRDAARAADLAWGAVSYHLAVLERLGAVRCVETGGRRRVFPATLDEDERRAMALLAHESTHRLLTTLDLEPGVTQTVLAQRAQLSQPQVSRLLTRLRRVGLVDGDPARTSGLAVTPLGARLLRDAFAVPGADGRLPPDAAAPTVR